MTIAQNPLAGQPRLMQERAIVEQLATLLLSETGEFSTLDDFTQHAIEIAAAAAEITITRWCLSCGEFAVEAHGMCTTCLVHHDEDRRETQSDDDRNAQAFAGGMWG